MIQQVSVFLENRSGQLSEITRFLSDAGVDLRALNIAETKDYGILRLIVSSTEKTLDVLKEHGYVGTSSEVFAVSLPDRPGSLSAMLELVSGAGMDVEYMYSIFSQREGHACLVFRVAQEEECAALLEKSGVRQVSAEDLGIH